ncbi:MAG: hypothetical protein B6I20_07250 [Bacteroidetes bacterium 4572_117]|nr:MAG: hypothetical protein B6I20_07250 [Bacteroidetes bacterium 4572_117]
MGIFNNFFQLNKKTKFHFSDEPPIFFGRYSDSNKTKLQYEHWNKSLNYYKDKKYLEAYWHFFKYLEDKTIKNVLFNRENNKINFKIFQGSKVVSGLLNFQEIYAEAEVVSFDEINEAVMLKLLHENNSLNYSKFVIKNNVYSIKYFSQLEDVNPQSLYFALKELATKADMFDDVLTEKFNCVHPINMEHVLELPIEEKKVKLKYFRIWIEETIRKIEKTDTKQKADIISYTLLNFLFKTHYLLAPEGTLLDNIRNLQKSFFAKDGFNQKEKNRFLLEGVKGINKKTDAEIMKSLYKVEFTFAEHPLTNIDIVNGFFADELDKVQACINNNEIDDALEICRYILVYSAFTFRLPAVASNLVQIIWQVFYPVYFKELGFVDEYFINNTGELNIELIKAKIEKNIINAKKQHTNLKFNTQNIEFSDKLTFVISFYKEFRNLALESNK